MTDLSEIRALTFDVFGTVVDWRSGIIRDGEALGRAKGLAVDWARFADAWRALYQPALSQVRDGTRPWTKLDDLHRESLERLLVEFNRAGKLQELLMRYCTPPHILLNSDPGRKLKDQR